MQSIYVKVIETINRCYLYHIGSNCEKQKGHKKANTFRFISQ